MFCSAIVYGRDGRDVRQRSPVLHTGSRRVHCSAGGGLITSNLWYGASALELLALKLLYALFSLFVYNSLQK